MQKRPITRAIFYFSLLIVFSLSMVKANDIPRLNELSIISDKFIHFLIYFYLGYVGLLCKFKISDYFIVSAVFAFSLFIEVIHFYHPYRLFEYFDLLANLIGVTIALLVGRLKN